MSNLLSKRESLRSIRNLDPFEFEHFIADLWEARGYETQVRTATGDRGIDIVGIKASDDSEFKELIQAKRYSGSNNIGSQTVREYATLYQQVPDADRVTIVSSGYFTSEANRLANDLGINLVNADQLFELVNAHAEIGIEYLHDPDGPNLGTPSPSKTTSKSSNQHSILDSLKGIGILLIVFPWLGGTWIVADLIVGDFGNDFVVFIIWVVIQVISLYIWMKASVWKTKLQS